MLIASTSVAGFGFRSGKAQFSALLPKADIRGRGRHVRFVPKADISSFHSIPSSALDPVSFYAPSLGFGRAESAVAAPWGGDARPPQIASSGSRCRGAFELRHA